MKSTLAIAHWDWGWTGKSAILGGLLLALNLGGGCLSRPPLHKESFAFPIPPLVSKRAETSARRLEIGQVRIAAPFDSQSFVYRTGPDSYEHDPYAEFLVPPAESLQASLRDYFRNAGGFSDVLSAGDAPKADTAVEVYVGELYGDFRSRSAPAAVLRMGFRFFDTRGGSSGAVLLEKEYEQRVALKTRTAAGVMAGWNKALEQILRGVAADLKAAAS